MRVKANFSDFTWGERIVRWGEVGEGEKSTEKKEAPVLTLH